MERVLVLESTYCTWHFQIKLKLHSEFIILSIRRKGITLTFTILFSLILINNFIGLFPYIFTTLSNNINITCTPMIKIYIIWMN